eukprot:TRINITY_DN9947_c1_g1_i1.p1 TRINITY_DN9947_c1_g1~~TRINITY_DN9947_c1_g1_i1.p1  ORF type:complete len:525 (+),score=118.61 TRINITY_DN9947_c1_g1_i1:64-1638(+)
MAIEEQVLDIAKRFSKELGQARERCREERERLAKSLEAERQGLAEELEQREQRIEEERNALGYDQVRIEIMKAGFDDDVLALNVGGEVFSARRSTLCVFEGSYLANLFSGRWESSIEKDNKGRFFLDFDPVCFRLILNFLRAKRLESSHAPATPPAVPSERLEQFQHLVEYFGLTEQLEEAEKLSAEAKIALLAAEKKRRQKKKSTKKSLLSPLAFSATPPATADVAATSTEAAAAATAPQTLSNGVSPNGMTTTTTAAQVANPASVTSDFSASAATTSGPPSASAPTQVPASELLRQMAPPSSRPSKAAQTPAPKKRNVAVSVLEFFSRGKSSSSQSSAQETVKKMPGWSRKGAHSSAVVDEEDPSVVRISNTQSSGAAAAVRSTRGFRSGQHAWQVAVRRSSDWSYVGFAAETWTAVSSCVGRSPNSWGIASNGVVYAGREEIGRLQEYTTGSCLTFAINMDTRTASVAIDGKEFPDVFSNLPVTVFPAVSNCRSPAEYQISFMEEDSQLPASGASSSSQPH